MGTQDYKADVSEALKKFMRINPGHPPGTLMVNYRDAMDWLTHSGSTSLISPFVNVEVKNYMNTIPFQQTPLRCSVRLLDVEDQTPTHFVSKVEELRDLLARRGFEVEYESQWRIEGWHFAFSHSNLPRTVVIFANEVFADWNPAQILDLLDRCQWQGQGVLGTARGQRVLRFTNQGFSTVEPNVA